MKWRAHYHYRCIHQMNLMLLRTCNFISGTGILFTHFLILSAYQIVFHIQVYAIESIVRSMRVDVRVNSFEFLSSRLSASDEQTDEIRKMLRCFRFVHKKNRSFAFDTGSTQMPVPWYR